MIPAKALDSFQDAYRVDPFHTGHWRPPTEGNVQTSPSMLEGTFRNPRIVATAVLAAALLVRIAYVLTLQIDEPIRADAQKYFLLAFNWLNHGVYSSGSAFPLQTTTFITPGYPAFLSGIMYFSDSLEGFVNNVVWVQTVFSSGSCALLYAVTRRFLSNAWAAASAGLFVLSPHAIIGAGYMLTETVFTFLSLAAILLLIIAVTNSDRRWYMAAGLMFALAALVRPGLMLYPLFVTVLLFAAGGTIRIPIKDALVLVAAFAVAVLPWLYWAQTNADNPENSPLAEQLALGSYPNLIHERPEMRGFPYRDDPQYAVMAKSTSKALQIIRARAADEPARYLAWYLLGKPATYHQANLIIGDGGPFIFPVQKSIYDISRIASATRSSLMALHPLLVLMASGMALFALVRLFSAPNDSSALALALCASFFAYFTVLHTALAPLPRYSIPLHPFIYGLATAGATQLARIRGGFS